MQQLNDPGEGAERENFTERWRIDQPHIVNIDGSPGRAALLCIVNIGGNGERPVAQVIIKIEPAKQRSRIVGDKAEPPPFPAGFNGKIEGFLPRELRLGRSLPDQHPFHIHTGSDIFKRHPLIHQPPRDFDIQIDRRFRAGRLRRRAVSGPIRLQIMVRLDEGGQIKLFPAQDKDDVILLHLGEINAHIVTAIAQLRHREPR